MNRRAWNAAPGGSRRWPSWLAAAVAAAAAGLAVLTGAAPASAHTDLVSSSPAGGASLTSAPTRIVLRFNEEISRDLALVTLAVDGSRPARLPIASGGPASQVVATTSEVPVSTAASGTVDWTVSYRVASDDGHPVEGQLVFRAPAPRTTTAQSSESEAAAPHGTAPDATTVDRFPAGSGTGWSTVVVAAVTAVGVAFGCGWLIRARRRSEES